MWKEIIVFLSNSDSNSCFFSGISWCFLSKKVFKYGYVFAKQIFYALTLAKCITRSSAVTVNCDNLPLLSYLAYVTSRHLSDYRKELENILENLNSYTAEPNPL